MQQRAELTNGEERTDEATITRGAERRSAWLPLRVLEQLAERPTRSEATKSALMPLWVFQQLTRFGLAFTYRLNIEGDGLSRKGLDEDLHCIIDCGGSGWNGEGGGGGEGGGVNKVRFSKRREMGRWCVCVLVGV